MEELACTDVQLALLEGQASTALLEHAHACREGCRLVLELSGLLDAGSSESGVASEVSLPKGKILDRYELEEVIGHGGQGVVCRARDLETDEVVAIKFLPLEHHAGKVLELKLARRVTHPNVCRVHDTQTDGRNRLIIMEHVAGPSLAAVRERLSQGEALRIFQGICMGVHAAHEAGVLHLDLTPNNVLLRNEREPVVTDFGLSVALEDEARALGGTTGYMAPEQRHHERVDRRTDVYALGQLLRALVDQKPRRIRRVIRRATHQEPEQRYSTVAELVRALGPSVRLRWYLRGSGVVLAGGITAIAWFLVQAPPPGPRAEWREDYWGTDFIPNSAWNVARNYYPHGSTSVSLSHPMFACGNKPNDLFDGLAVYYQWGRGVAFPPAPTPRSPDAICVDLSLMGQCGTLFPEDIICEDTRSELHSLSDLEYRTLPLKGRDINLSYITPEQGDTMGKLVSRVPCGERWMAIDLAQDHDIFAFRAWFHDPPPRAWRLEVYGPEGLTVARSSKDDVFHSKAHYEARNLIPAGLQDARDDKSQVYLSVPITADFPKTHTSSLAFFFDTCSSIDPEEFRQYQAGATREDGQDYAPQIGWLYEIEVFAEVPWYKAWEWHLLWD